MPSTPTTSRSRSTPSSTPPSRHRSLRAVARHSPGDRPGALRVRAPGASSQNGADAGPGNGSSAAYRVLDRFVPTVPFRYLPPKQSVRMAFNVILDREPDRRAAPSTPGSWPAGSSHAVAWPRRWPTPRSSAATCPSPTCSSPCTSAGASSWPGCPAPTRILDLGGTHQGLPDGALVHLGYPYPFERLVVVDLPVDERDEIYQGGSTGEAVLSELGPVEFAFHSMVDLGRYGDGSFDLVYSGQSIEHVTEADGDAVVREAFRVLAPGGWFCLDTPNGPVWRLRSDEPMNHDHKIEYGGGRAGRQARARRVRGDRVQGPQPDASGRGGGRVRRGRGRARTPVCSPRPRTACCWRWWRESRCRVGPRREIAATSV